MIFKEQLTNISTVLNNTGNTTKLLTSFSTLDASQQKVLLSSKLLTEEQKNQCIVMSMLSSANTKYTAEQLSKTAGISAETLANWGLTSSTDTLTISELAEKAATDAQAKSAFEKIVTQNAQAVANGELTASNVALTASETGATLATGAFTTAIKANISAMKTWLLTTPTGWITMLVGGIFLAVKAYDALTVSIEEQKEKMEDSLSAYNDAKSELKNITTELDDQKQAMDDLLGKEKLTYAEKGQLEELQQITEELRIQKDLAEKEENRTQKEVASDAATLFQKQFGKYDISDEAIDEYQTNANITGNNVTLVSDENNLSAMIAGYKQFNDLLDKAYSEKNQKDIDHFTSLTEDLKDSIFSTAQDLQTQQDNISDYYNTIKNIPYEELTSDKKEIVDAYTAISNAIAIIYKELDPNSWNEIQMDRLFTTDGIEKTKDELVEMAKEGTLNESTIRSYSKLNSTLEYSNLILSDGQSAASALCDEMYALADAEKEVQDLKSNDSSILFEDLFNNDSIDSTKQKLLDLATSGELSAETITSTEDYKALLDELGISADEFVNKISEFNIQYNEDNYNSLIDLLSRVRKGEILSSDEATTLIATYDSLAGELVKTGDGYSFNESAIISLTNKYAETSNLAISNEVKKTNAAIEGVKERINAYGIEMEALKTIQKIYEDTGSKIEVMNWLKDNGYSMFMASNYLDIANEYSELEKKSESLKGKMLEQIETSSAARTSALDRIKNKFQELTDVIGSNLNLIKSQISLLETRGSTVGRAYYDELISQSTEKINVLTEKYNELRKQFLQTDKGTEEWLELNAVILETQDAIIGAKTDIEGFQNSIDKLHWDELDKIADAIGNISDEAKSVVDLLNTDDVLDDNGNFTKDTITALAMYGEQLESAQYLINKYSKEIEYLNGEYTKGTITVEEYNEKTQDLNDKQWESVDAYNAAKKAIIELRKKGIDEEIDALEELYDARKKAWEQEKDQHDWEKTVSENETNINKLKAQIDDVQNDNSLAGIKKRKGLEDELNKAESDWEDTLYDHVYDERQDQLDKELDDKKNALEKTLDDEEKLVADSIDLVNKNCSTVLDNLNRLSREYGIQMSNSLTEPFTHGENALSHYSTMFSEANSAFTDQLNYTAMGIYQLQVDADNAAVSVVNMFNSANGTLLEQLSLVRQSLQEITDKANEAANAVRNANVNITDTTKTTSSNKASAGGGGKSNFTMSKAYASGTPSATKGLHPMFEKGVEVIEKDGNLIMPLSGGEKVFNNEQTQRLWELSQNPDVMEKFRQELSNIRPYADFRFDNSAPVTKTNQNVNVQQHFDALVKVEGDMTPDVYKQLATDKRIDSLLEGKTFKYLANAYNTRGYRL